MLSAIMLNVLMLSAIMLSVVAPLQSISSVLTRVPGEKLLLAKAGIDFMFKLSYASRHCPQCAPERYNYPSCEECNCNPDGVTEDFFAKGGCDTVPPGSLCTCKANVMGRICDTCKPLFWNLQGWNPSE